MGDKINDPAEAAWEKYKAAGNAYAEEVRLVFINGWNAALAWLPVRIAQFREIEEAQRKEIEELKARLKNRSE